MRTVWEKYTTELYTMQLRVAWTGSLGWVGLTWVRSHIKHHPPPTGELKKYIKDTNV